MGFRWSEVQILSPPTKKDIAEQAVNASGASRFSFKYDQCGTFAGVFPANTIRSFEQIAEFSRRVVGSHPPGLVAEEILSVLEGHSCRT